MKDKKKWIEAMQTVLKLHQIALNSNLSYDQVTTNFNEGKQYSCVFCNMSLRGCSDCVWVYFTGIPCNDTIQSFDFTDDEESIERLTKWIVELTEGEE